VSESLCSFLKTSNVSLDPQLAKQVIAYAALSALERGDVERAKRILVEARRRRLLDPAMEQVLDRITASERVLAKLNEALDTANRLLGIAVERNIIHTGLLAELGRKIEELRGEYAAAKAKGLGLDERPLNYLEDLYLIMDTVKEELHVVNRLNDLYSRLASALQAAASADTIEGIADAFKRLDRLANEAIALAAEAERGRSQLLGLQLKTSEGRQIRDQLASSLVAAKALANAANIIAARSSVIGVYLGNTYKYIRGAYGTDPNVSPFGGAGDAFINAVATVLSTAKQMVDEVERLAAGAPPGSLAPARELARGIADTAKLIMKNLKYSTTFQDYRWNKVWERAESRAGVDLGRITKADVQRYEFKGCTPDGCRLVEREGLLGRLLEELPDEALAFFTTVEDFLRDIEQANRWWMRTAKNPLSSALAHYGYIGAAIVNAVGSLAAPRMLAEQVQGLAYLAGKWKRAVESGSIEEVKRVGRETFDLLFGSREAILQFIAGLMLAAVGGVLAAKGLPKGAKVPLKRAIAAELIQGDIIGPLLVLVERALPTARIRGLARTIVGEGRVKLSNILDDAGIMARALKKAGAMEKIGGVKALGDLRSLLKTALKNADTLKQAHEALEKAVLDIGLRELADQAAAYRAAKTTMASNLASLTVHAPTAVNRLRNLARRLAGREVPREGLPSSLRRELERLLEARERLPTAVGNEAVRAALDPRHAKTLQAIERIARAYEAAGAARLAEAFRAVRENYEALAGEVKRLKDLARTLDELEAIAELARKQGLWRESVDLGRKWKPGRGWGRRVRVDPADLVEQLKAQALRRLAEREALLNRLSRELRVYANRLERGVAEAQVTRLADDIARAFEEAGLTDVAKELRREAEKLRRLDGKTPARDRLATLLDAAAEKLASKVAEWRRKYEASVTQEEVAEAAARTPWGELGVRVDGAARMAVAKAYLVGARVGEALANALAKLSDRLAVGDAALARRLAKAIERQYSDAALENLAFLKGVRDALRAIEKTPMGALLSQIDRAIARTLEAVEREAPEHIPRTAAKAVAGEVAEATGELASRFIRLQRRMEEMLREVPGGKELLARLPTAVGDPDEVIRELRRYAEEKGVAVPEEFWPALREYLAVRRVGQRLVELGRKLEAGKVSLGEVQRVIDELAMLDVDLAWRADWRLVTEYIRELQDRLSRLDVDVGDLKRVDLQALFVARRLARLAEHAAREIGDVAEAVRAGRTAGAREALEGVYDRLRRVFGDEEVAELRKALDDFYRSLDSGAPDLDALARARRAAEKLASKYTPRLDTDVASVVRRLDVDRVIRLLEEVEPRRGPWTRLRQVLELRREATAIADALDKLYEVVERGFGADKTANLRRLIGEFKEKLARGEFDADLLKRINREVLKLKLLNPHKAVAAELRKLRAWLGEQAARLRGARDVERALNELSATIKRLEEAEEAEGWVALDRIIEASRARFVRVPKELADRVARMITEREAAWTVKSSVGDVRVKRVLDVGGDGTFTIRYEITFPGNRKITLVEAVKADASGKLHVYKRFMHDPTIAEALQAYELVKRGAREMDDLARLGQAVEELLSRGLRAIDPDYDVLSRIALLNLPATAPLEAVIRDLLAGAAALTAAATAVGDIASPAAAEAAAEAVPPAVFEAVRDAIARLAAGTASEEDKTVLSLTLPLASRLAPAYSRLSNPALVLSGEELDWLRARLGARIIAAAPLPDELKAAIAGGITGDAGNLKFYLILPEASSTAIPVFLDPDHTVTLRFPDDYSTLITLPAIIRGGKVYVVLPPLAIQVPEELSRELEASLQLMAIPQPQPQEPAPPTPTPIPYPGRKGAAMPLLPPLVPIIPWMGGGRASGGLEREKLNI